MHSMTQQPPIVIGGVDAHADSHHLGSYASGLVRYLREHDVAVIEVNQPHPHARRRLGKSDPIDAELAARALLSGTATAVPKQTEGIVEAIRLLRVAREGAVKARTAATLRSGRRRSRGHGASWQDGQRERPRGCHPARGRNRFGCEDDPTQIKTTRLAFREMTETDLDAMANLLGDPRVMTYYPRPKTRFRAQSRSNAFIRGERSRGVRRDRARFAAEGATGANWVQVPVGPLQACDAACGVPDFEPRSASERAGEYSPRHGHRPPGDRAAHGAGRICGAGSRSCSRCPAAARTTRTAPLALFPILGPGTIVWIVTDRYVRDDTVIWTSTNGGVSFSAPYDIPSGQVCLPGAPCHESVPYTNLTGLDDTVVLHPKL